MPHISIIEDDRGLNDGIVLALKQDSFTFSQYYRLKDAKDISRSDLLILYINLPDGSGLDLLREVRQTSAGPIILLTANDLEMDIVSGLESGADDYITKPFSLAVLRARVNAQLRRGTPVQTAAVELEGFSFDFEQMVFTAEGETVELSKTEQKLLRLLVSNCGNTLSRDMLIDRIWSDGAEFVEENALSVTMNRLRAKLPGAPIKTVYGIGYVWGKG